MQGAGCDAYRVYRRVTAESRINEQSEDLEPVEQSEPCGKQRKLSNHESTFIETLGYANPAHKIYQAQIPEPAPGTCQWVLDHPQYKEWSSRSASLLWTTGEQGCGKSVLAKFLRQTLSEDTPSMPAVCSFSFKAGEPRYEHAHWALCTLLHQLYHDHHVSIPNVPERKCLAHKESFVFNLTQLWDNLLSASTMKPERSIVLVIDGIHECPAEVRENFLNLLLSTFKDVDSAHELGKVGSLKVIVTSQPSGGRGTVSHQFASPHNGIQHIDLSAGDEATAISADIIKAVGFEVDKLEGSGNFSNKACCMLRDVLPSRACGNFLLASMMLEAIKLRPTQDDGSITETLDMLSADWFKVYEVALSMSPMPQATRNLLHILLAAARPLTLDEISIVLNIREFGDAAYSHSLQDVDIESMVKMLAGFLVRIVDSRVYLAHQTVRHFLIKDAHTSVSAPESSSAAMQWRHSFDIQESHWILANICITFLQLKDWEDVDSNVDHRTVLSIEPQSVEAFTNAFKKHAEQRWVGAGSFYEYAAPNWIYHLEKDGRFMSKEFTCPVLEQSVKTLCIQPRPTSSMWYFILKHFGTIYRHSYFRVDMRHFQFFLMATFPVVLKGVMMSDAKRISDKLGGDDILVQAVQENAIPCATWIMENFSANPLEWETAFRDALRLYRPRILEKLFVTRPDAVGKEIFAFAGSGAPLHSMKLFVGLAKSSLPDYSYREGVREALRGAVRHGRLQAMDFLRDFSHEDAQADDLTEGLIKAIRDQDEDTVRGLLQRHAKDTGEGLLAATRGACEINVLHLLGSQEYDNKTVLSVIENRLTAIFRNIHKCQLQYAAAVVYRLGCAKGDTHYGLVRHEAENILFSDQYAQGPTEEYARNITRNDVEWAKDLEWANVHIFSSRAYARVRSKSPRGLSSLRPFHINTEDMVMGSKGAKTLLTLLKCLEPRHIGPDEYLETLKGATSVIFSHLHHVNRPYMKLLNAACLYGHLELTKVIVQLGGNIQNFFTEMGRSVETADCDGVNPLLAATISGNARLVEWLLNAGAQMNVSTYYIPWSFDHRRAIEYLQKFIFDWKAEEQKQNLAYKLRINIDKSPEAESMLARNEYGMGTYGWVASIMEARFLLNPMGSASSNIGSALSVSLSIGYEDIAVALIRKGAIQHLKDEQSRLLKLQWAISHKNADDALVAMTKGFSAEIPRSYLQQQLTMAAFNAMAPVVGRLMELGISLDTFPGANRYLAVAIRLRDTAMIEQLVRAGMVLELAHLPVSLDWEDALRTNSVHVIGLVTRLAIQTGTASPLHDIARLGKRDVLERLMEACKPLMKTKDGEGQTPLHVAVVYRNYEAVEVLLKAESCIANTDNRRRTVLHDVLHTYDSGMAAGVLGHVIQAQQNLDVVDDMGITIMQEAVYGAMKSGSVGLIQQFMSLGLSLNVRTQDGTLIHHAIKAAKGVSDELASRLAPEVVRCLVDHGINPRERNEAGLTPLEYCDEMLSESENSDLTTLLGIREFLEGSALLPDYHNLIPDDFWVGDSGHVDFDSDDSWTDGAAEDEDEDDDGLDGVHYA